MTIYKGVVITDLDGTLLNSEKGISPKDIVTLELLGDQKYVRIIATGRSLYSVRKVLPLYVPVDYIIFSSGAGILDWQTNQVIQRKSLPEKDLKLTISVFDNQKTDYSIQEEIPDNHYYTFVKYSDVNPDFDNRNKLYRDFAIQVQPDHSHVNKACQLIGIVPGDSGLMAYKKVRDALPRLSVIRSTSPLDGQSTWIEVFPKGVSKSNGVKWLLKNQKIHTRNIMAIGNDYNDIDLLRWSPNSFVVENSPEEIRNEFQTVTSNNKSGFSEAVSIWLNEKM
ncbi:HAD-IIB family hydrolase [Bacteroidota bacterium]